MYKQITENGDGNISRIKGEVAVNAVAFLDTTTGGVATAPATNGGLVGVSKGFENGVSTIVTFTPEARFELDAADIASVSTVAADIAAKEVVFVYLDKTNDTLTVVSTDNGTAVGRILSSPATGKYVVKFYDAACIA